MICTYFSFLKFGSSSHVGHLLINEVWRVAVLPLSPKAIICSFTSYVEQFVAVGHWNDSLCQNVCLFSNATRLVGNSSSCCVRFHFACPVTQTNRNGKLSGSTPGWLLHHLLFDTFQSYYEQRKYEYWGYEQGEFSRNKKKVVAAWAFGKPLAGSHEVTFYPHFIFQVCRGVSMLIGSSCDPESRAKIQTARFWKPRNA